MQNQMSENHCVELEPHIQQHSKDHAMQTSLDCSQSLAKIDHKQHTHCQECSSLSCQLSIAYINMEQSTLRLLRPFTALERPHFYYLNQDLSGYGNKIIRPPKA